MNELDSLVDTARAAFAQAKAPADLENAKALFLGKAGRITELMKGMAQLPVDEKKSRGAAINVVKQAIEAALTERRQQLADEELAVQLRAESLDVTLPGRRAAGGGLHPVSRTLERIEAIFSSMGFDVADGPEIESDWHSFTSLNNPPNHPARSMQDTFYVDIDGDDGIPYNLRPHTSPMQVRYAHQHIKKYAAEFEAAANDASGQTKAPEIRVIAPGRTYRVDSDATHSPMFHQCEGLWLGENVSFKDLKVVFTDFCRTFFESDDLVLRFRPQLLPLHRAERRNRHPVPERPAGRPLARGRGLRPGASERGAQHGA
jgi:phenylalanyl-tRNA synthetase alpha chain